MRLFTEHPRSVGESYLEHTHSALYFGLNMIAGGVACCIHGLLPFLFETTGSRRVTMLHERMVVHRNRRAQPSSGGAARME
jgi:Family of unknown function (DUF6356)